MHKLIFQKSQRRQFFSQTFSIVLFQRLEFKSQKLYNSD